jgi:hypothetical protein
MNKSNSIVAYSNSQKNIQQDRGRLGIEGEFEIEVLVQETVGRRNESPEKPIEDGYSISDNTTVQPITFVLQISSNAWNWRDQRRALENFSDKKVTLMYYSPINKTIYRNMIIESLDFKANVKQSTGFTADLKLKQLRIISASETTLEVMPDANGEIPQETTPGSSSEGAPGVDNLEGKPFDQNGILWNFNNRGEAM